MGFFRKISRNMPGSPKNVAKLQLRIYRSYLAQNPGKINKDALRCCIESRYKIIKMMSRQEIESYLAEADTLGHLVFLMLAGKRLIKERPTPAEYLVMEYIVEDLYDFFMVNAPEEIGILQPMMDLVSITHRLKTR